MSVSQKQYQILINFMEAHGDLDLENPLWDQLTSELNKAGTPLSRDEWADVWKLKKIRTTRFFSNYVIKESKNKLTQGQSKIIKILGLSKETILKQNKVLPKSVHSYYAELYIKNKRNLSDKITFNSMERKMMHSEANQSWQNLPAAMKKAVILKHKQARDLRYQKIADYLENVEFNQLPVEPQSSTWEIKEYNPSVEDVGNDANETDKHEEGNAKETEDCTNNLTCNDFGDSPPRVMDDTIDNSLRSNTGANDYTEPPPPPPPPTVTTAEELYGLLQRTQEMEQIPWISLPETEKRQFRSAINSLKKDYLRQYRSYLHNLPSSDLHKHMVQTLFHDII